MHFLTPRFTSPAAYEAAARRIGLEAAFGHGFARMYGEGRLYGQLEAYPLAPVEWERLRGLSEAAWLIGQRLTDLARQAPDALLDAVNLMDAYRPWLRSEPPGTPFAPFVRVDWVRDERGQWHLVEFNAREPGGLPELALFDLIYGLYREQGLPVSNPNAGFAGRFQAMMQAAFGDAGPVGFCATPGYPEDQENVARAARLWGGEALFGGWPTVSEDGTLRVSGEPVAGLYLYLPTELYWRQPGLLERLAAGGLPVLNPGAAVFIQNKKALALAHTLCEQRAFWTEAERAWIERYVPYTALEPFEGEWVAKPAWAREGAGVHFGAGSGPGEPEYIYQRRIHVEQGELPIWTVTGPVLERVTPVVGVYLLDGRAAGVLTRVGGPVTDRTAHVVPTLLWDA